MFLRCINEEGGRMQITESAKLKENKSRIKLRVRACGYAKVNEGKNVFRGNNAKQKSVTWGMDAS